MAKVKTMPSVLAFEKKLVPSDGFFFGTTWEARTESAAPLRLQEKSVRGTISNRLPAKLEKDPLKLNAEVEKPNLQTVDSCGLGLDQDTLKLTFTLKVLSGVQTPSACNNHEFQEQYRKVAETYIKEQTFAEAARRYSANIAGGRFFWRNRVGAEELEVRVKLSGSEGKTFVFDGYDLDLTEFASLPPEVEKLGAEIAAALAGEKPYLLLEIDAYALVGKAQEVYPSEELVLDKSKSSGGKKSKILYSVKEVAAMHSQKIGNALRTIDTWYPGAESELVGPVAVEPYGAVTNLGRAFRNPKEKADFYTLFERFVHGDLPEAEDQHYVMAVLVRGGVFGEKA